MLKLRILIVLIAICLLLNHSSLLAQRILVGTMIHDSLVRKLRIKQVTKNWYSAQEERPSNTTIEFYNQAGYRTKRIFINHLYYKFIHDYIYNFKRDVLKVKEYYFDWNPHREKRKGDTILKKKTYKYGIQLKRKLGTKPNVIEEFKSKKRIDKKGRLIELIDSVKFGYRITQFQYDERERVSSTEIKIHLLQLSRDTILYSRHNFHYNSKGFVSKELNYFDFKLENGMWRHSGEENMDYIYSNEGLVLEATRENRNSVGEKYENLPIVSKFKYSYEFY